MTEPVDHPSLEEPGSATKAAKRRTTAKPRAAAKPSAAKAGKARKSGSEVRTTAATAPVGKAATNGSSRQEAVEAESPKPAARKATVRKSSSRTPVAATGKAEEAMLTGLDT